MSTSRPIGEYWVTFDQMTWPARNLADLEWQLRYREKKKDFALSAASVVAAYVELLNMPQRRRNRVISQIRAARMPRRKASR